MSGGTEKTNPQKELLAILLASRIRRDTDDLAREAGHFIKLSGMDKGALLGAFIDALEEAFALVIKGLKEELAKKAKKP